MNPNNFSVNLCEEKNIGLVMDFIGKEWAKGHILSKDMELMSWQYGANTNFYNWFLGTNGGSISGILGFIPISKFDSSLVNHDFIWLALWKVRDGKKTQGLGLRLLRELLSKRPASGFGVLGINPDHLKLYKSLGFEVGQLIQSYIINQNSEQTLILNPMNELLPRAKSGNAILKLIEKKDLRNISLKSDEIIPSKSSRYFMKRFYSHPIYTYQVYLVQKDSKDKALIATRIAEHEGSKALRIVDFYGEESILAECGSALQNLMDIRDCEYCDFWQYGVSEDTLTKCGFSDASNSSVVIPNFFEPFKSEVAPISFAIKSSKDTPFRIFRADGDQDRPNSRPINTQYSQ